MHVSTYCHIITSIINKFKPKTTRIDVSMTPKEKSTEDWLSQKVQDTIEDCFGVWRDQVATFADTPSDWV